MGSCTTRAGEVITLGSQIGQPGGEGTIYAVHGRPRLVAKVYHDPVSSEKEAKLLGMAEAARSAGGFDRCGMPTEVLYRQAQPVGFLLPFFSGCQELHLLTSPQSRREIFPAIRFDFLLHVARNLVIEVGKLHRAGIVIGDVNSRGFLVSSDGMVHVIDCDSFQIRIGGTTYRTEVGLPEYLPPEMQNGVTLGSFDRTEDHDRFGVGVLLFQLLFQDRHPYAGVPLNKREPELSLSETIKRHRFAFGSRAKALGTSPPPLSLPLGFFPQEVQSCFEACFAMEAVRDGRPSMVRWTEALGDAASHLRPCPVADTHMTFAQSQRCAWCDIESVGGPFYFSATDDQAKANASSALSAKQQLDRLLSASPTSWTPTRSTPRQPTSAATDLVALVSTRKQGLARAQSTCYSLAFFSGLLGVAGCTMRGGNVSLFFFIASIVLGVVGKSVGSLVEIPAAVRWGPPADFLRAARKRRGELTEHLAAVPGADIHNAHLGAEGQAKYLRSQYDRAERDQAEAINTLLAQDRDLQLMAYLGRFSVLSVKIPNIGPARQSALHRAGVVTAAAIRRGEHRRVSNITSLAAQHLEDWSQRMASTFRYDQKKSGKNAEVDALVQTHARALRKLNDQCLPLCETIARIRRQLAQIPSTSNTTIYRMQDELAQLGVDIHAVESGTTRY